MKEKIQQVIKLLKEIDDELENELCLENPNNDEETFSFWGVASMIQDYAEREEKSNG